MWYIQRLPSTLKRWKPVSKAESTTWKYPTASLRLNFVDNVHNTAKKFKSVRLFAQSSIGSNCWLPLLVRLHPPTNRGPCRHLRHPQPLLRRPHLLITFLRPRLLPQFLPRHHRYDITREQRLCMSLHDLLRLPPTPTLYDLTLHHYDLTRRHQCECLRPPHRYQ